MNVKFPHLCAEIERGFERKLHRGIQLYVSVDGQVVADRGFGESRPDQPMQPDTINRWLSSGKPITAVAMAILKERGHLDWDDSVAQHLPEFTDKPDITLRHLLTHTSGMPKLELQWPDREWQQLISVICNASPEHSAGKWAAYQPAATWFLLGEIIARISGRSFSDFVRKEICEPLGMQNSWNGMPTDAWASYGDTIGMMWARRRAQLELLSSHEQRMCVAASPGGNFRGPINELGAFYEMLLGQGTRNVEGNAVTILQPDSVQDLSARHREGKVDNTFQHLMDFGLGFIVDSNRYGVETVPYGFGRYSSKHAFGHGGAESSSAFVDPQYKLVVAWAANVRAGEGRHQSRNRAINSAIYQDLGLVPNG